LDTLNKKDTNGWNKRCMTWEVEGIRQTGLLSGLSVWTHSVCDKLCSALYSSSLYRRLRYINCLNYITLHYARRRPDRTERKGKTQRSENCWDRIQSDMGYQNVAKRKGDADLVKRCVTMKTEKNKTDGSSGDNLEGLCQGRGRYGEFRPVPTGCTM